MYSVFLELKRNCPLELSKELLRRDFSIELVGDYSQKRVPITDPKIMPIWSEKSHLECLANLGGDENSSIFSDPMLLKLLYDYRNQIIGYKIGNLPF